MADVVAPSASGSPRRGLWVWELEQRAPAAEEAAALAASWGFGRVFLKSGNGNESVRWPRNFRQENIDAFVRHGVEVWAFAYFYPGDLPDAKGSRWGTLEEQVDVVVRTSQKTGVVGLVVDAEDEFNDRPAEATKLCALLRQKLGEKSLAYTSFGWVSMHPRFPFRAFDAGCGDAFLPQVYSTFGWKGGVEASLERLNRDMASLGLKAPVWPVQSNEPDPDERELARFFSLAGANASVFHMHPRGSSQHRRLARLSEISVTPE